MAGSYTPSRRGSIGGRQAAQTTEYAPNNNIACEVLEMHVVDKRGRSTPWTPELAKLATENAAQGKTDAVFDHYKVRALVDGPEQGIVAGNEYTIIMPELKGGKKHRSLAELAKAVNGNQTAVGSIVYFERSYLRRDGLLAAKYSSGGPSAAEQEAGVKTVFPGFYITVLPEYKTRAGKPAQFVQIIDTANAVKVKSADDIKSAYESSFGAGFDLGTPSILILGRKLAPEGLSDEEKVAFASDPASRTSAFLSVWSDKTEVDGNTVYTPVAADAAVAKFFEKNREMADMLADPEWEAEFVAVITITQSSMSILSARKADMERQGKSTDGLRDIADTFRIIDKDENGEFVFTEQGVTLGTASIERKVSADGERGPPYSPYQNTITAGAPRLSYLPDVPTPGMPEYHRIAVAADAERLARIQKEHYKATAPVKPDAEEGAPRP